MYICTDFHTFNIQMHSSLLKLFFQESDIARFFNLCFCQLKKKPLSSLSAIERPKQKNILLYDSFRITNFKNLFKLPGVPELTGFFNRFTVSMLIAFES